jgi:hypothetical protein
MNISENLKKRILSKIEEGYEKGGRLIDEGEVALYPDPAPAVDPTVSGSGKVLQVDSDLLRDLLNWATSADAGSIDAVVSKAEEIGVSAPLTPAQLIDLTATAQTADPSNPTVAGTNTLPDMAPATTSPVVPAGPVGPLSPVMQSFVRRGNKLDELASLPGMDKGGAKKINVAQQPNKPEPMTPNAVAQLARAEKAGKGGEDTLYGNESDEHIVDEDDIIDSDHEVITDPSQMGHKNPDIKPEGGQTPTGLDLDDNKNSGNTGIDEEGIDGDVEGVAAAIADGIADGIAGDDLGTEPEVNALPGEGIPQNDDDAAINAELGEPVAPAVGAEGGTGLVGQLAALQARVAELEALIGSNAEGGEDELSIGGEEGDDVEGEIEIGGEEGSENGEEGGEESGEESGEEGDEDSDEEGSDDEEEGNDDESDDSEEADDDKKEDGEDKTLLLGKEK